MADTYIDELVTYPAKVIQKISSDKTCVGLILNKAPSDIVEEDFDKVLDENIFDYNYVDNTTDTSAAYIWVEAEIPSVVNNTIKNMRIYVTIACHKQYMTLKSPHFAGFMGNRRDNIARYVDKLLQQSEVFGIGKLSLISCLAQSSTGGAFTGRLLTYVVPEFNFRGLKQ